MSQITEPNPPPPEKKPLMSGWHRKGRLTIGVHIGGSPSSGQRVVQGAEWSYAHTVALFSAIPWPRAKRGTMSCMDDLKRPT